MKVTINRETGIFWTTAITWEGVFKIIQKELDNGHQLEWVKIERHFEDLVDDEVV